MGARHTLDLTSDVTHLIVGDVDTPKYKYVAKERPDIKVVLSEWVEAVRQSWMQGGEPDVEELDQKFRVPALYGLRICITGFEDSMVGSIGQKVHLLTCLHSDRSKRHREPR